jgi:hypothetical protein
VERSSGKVNSINETENEELVAKLNELLGIIKGNDTMPSTTLLKR